MNKKKSKLVRVNPEVWDKVSKAFPNNTDAERSKFLFDTHPLMKMEEFFQGFDEWAKKNDKKQKR